MTTFLTPYIYDIRYLITRKFQNLLISTKTETRCNLEHEMMMQEREGERKKKKGTKLCHENQWKCIRRELLIPGDRAGEESGDRFFSAVKTFDKAATAAALCDP